MCSLVNLPSSETCARGHPIGAAPRPDADAEIAAYRSALARRQRSAFRLAGWSGLLGLGLCALAVVLEGRPGPFPVTLVVVGVVSGLRGLYLRARRSAAV